VVDVGAFCGAVGQHLQVVVRSMDQMEVLYPDERETETNIWTSYRVFPSKQDRTMKATHAHVGPWYRSEGGATCC